MVPAAGSSANGAIARAGARFRSACAGPMAAGAPRRLWTPAQCPAGCNATPGRCCWTAGQPRSSATTVQAMATSCWHIWAMPARFAWTTPHPASTAIRQPPRSAPGKICCWSGSRKPLPGRGCTAATSPRRPPPSRNRPLPARAAAVGTGPACGCCWQRQAGAALSSRPGARLPNAAESARRRHRSAPDRPPCRQSQRS